MSFLTEDELEAAGFLFIGRNVRISRLASIHGHSRIKVGDNSRIDDFSVLSAGPGGIDIGRYVHIAVMCSIIGAARIEMQDFSGLSSRVSIYSSSDDYSGAAMTNPTVPSEFTDVDSRPVVIGRHVIVGAGAVILPGSVLGEGVAVAALALVRGNLEDFGIYAGVPCRRVRERSRQLLDHERVLEARVNGSN